jgi:hypothetical protein
MSGVRTGRMPSALAALCMAVLAAGCGKAPPAPEASVELRGTVTEGEGGPVARGPIHVAVYHAWSLTGELRHPLQFIAAFDIDGGEFVHTFSYPLDKGEGLAVYAWLDQDGDGVFCTPVNRTELSGLTVLEKFVPTDSPVTLQVALTTPCAGQDWFFPGRNPE